MKKRILIFDVIGQTLRPADSCDLTGIMAGTAEYLIARFNFSPEWYGCKIAASFWIGKDEYAVPVKNGECVIPKEALTGTRFAVSLTGVNSKYRITTNAMSVFQSVFQGV